MAFSPETLCTAFSGERCIAAGTLADVALAARAMLSHDPEAALLVLDDDTGRAIDLDLRGDADEVLERLGTPRLAEAEAPRGAGRPKLGVIAREVTLLPRHWEWLAAQSGGASAALRRLVETARRETAAGDLRRGAQEAAYRVMQVLAGDRPHFEEATRALFAPDRQRFDSLIAGWPADIRHHVARLAALSFVTPGNT